MAGRQQRGVCGKYLDATRKIRIRSGVPLGANRDARSDNGGAHCKWPASLIWSVWLFPLERRDGGRALAAALAHAWGKAQGHLLQLALVGQKPRAAGTPHLGY